ncbi:MAG: hypothetical protein ABIP20_14110 [Chthoniobacteraceae bacterium]
MKAHLLAPLFAALVFTGTAQSENPGKPPHDGPPPGGPMAERLKHRIEELRREGKNEEAERLERHAREMFAKRGGNPQGGHHEGSPGGNPGERAAHLAEAAKHLNAAGIHVSPEILEKLGHRFDGKKHERRDFSHGSPRSHGSAEEHSSGMPGRPGLSPQGNAGPGAGSPMEAMHHEIRMLAKQVQELRGMVQQQRGGQPNRGPHEPAKAGEDHGARPQDEARRDRPAAPTAPGGAREHRDGVPQPQGEHHPRGDARPLNPPGNPVPPQDRPRGDALVPPREG